MPPAPISTAPDSKTRSTQTITKPKIHQTTDHRPRKPSTSFHLLAGLASGFSSSILLQPADLLKTRIQQSGSHSLLGTVRTIIASPQPVRQLWRGTLPSVIRTSVGSALYFTALNNLRSRLAKSQTFMTKPDPSKIPINNGSSASSSTLPQLTPLANLSCGAFARASVGFVMMPITVIKVRYESNYYSYTSLLSAVRDIATKEGFKGFFAGFGATAIRDAPYAGLYVVFYEKGKGILSRFVTRFTRAELTTANPASAPIFILDDRISTPSTSEAWESAQAPNRSAAAQLTPTLSAGINFTSSAIAASLATLLTNPPDAIKTRLQIQPRKYRNSVQTLSLMLKEEGVRSLFDGLALRMARKAVSSALAWTVYEEVVRRAERKFVDAGGQS